ncbi:MAG TPA: hypothetical protein VLG76_03380 [Rhabdochlamydiaceae bacterium]|nr:hypothetical protein [Rhabdochlamydiaceae bacterium]
MSKSVPVTGAPAYVSNSSSLSLSTSSATTSRSSSISTGSSLIGHTPSSSSASSSLPRRHVSSDQSIVIESSASSTTALTAPAKDSKLLGWMKKAINKFISIFKPATLLRWMKKATNKFISIFKPATPSTNGLPYPLNTLVLSKKRMEKNANWTSLKDAHLFSISIFLSPEEAAHASEVCKLWKQSFDKPDVWKKQRETQGYAPIHPKIEGCLQGSEDSRFFPSILTIIAEYEGEPRAFDYKAVFAEPIPNAITPKSYETHFHNTKVLNPIPRPGNMRRENNKPDPDHPKNTIGQTHIWRYRPSSPKLQINGKVTELTMNILEKLVQNPLKGHPTKFEWVTCEISQEQRNASMGEEGWDLVPKTVCKGTRNIPFDRQVEIVRAKGYEIPYGPDVILTTLVWHVLTGEYPFGREPFTYTRTTSLTANGTWRWVVGGFGPSGLRVIGNGGFDFDHDFYGLAGLRKFS